MGADLEALLVEFGEAGAVTLFYYQAPAAFFQCLEPDEIGWVRKDLQLTRGGDSGESRKRLNRPVEMTFVQRHVTLGEIGRINQLSGSLS